MRIRADYHFHPNLPKDYAAAEEACKRWWKEFRQKKINCVIVTEHAYKNPERAYNLMLRTMPEGCFCFPGMEYLTKEGVDIVVFSGNPRLYSYPQLQPYKLSFSRFVDFVISKKLYSYVTHPFTLGTTSVMRNISESAYFDSVNRLRAVEVANSTFDTLYRLLRIFPLSLMFRKKIEMIKRTKNLPKEYYPLKTRFLAAGSDAHHHGEIGTCFEINVKSLNEKAVFNAVVANRTGKLINPDNGKCILTLFKVMFTPLGEYLIKKRVKICGK